MGLIKCPECGKEVSELAAACPNCGAPIAVAPKIEEDHLACPKCKSTQLHAEQKGFSGGKALVGAVTLGGLGLLAGTIGSKEVRLTCLKCGNQFKAGEAMRIPVSKAGENEIENDVRETLVATSDFAKAMRVYQSKTNASALDAVKYVKDVAAKYGIDINERKTDGNEQGGAGLIFVIIFVAVFSFLLLKLLF